MGPDRCGPGPGPAPAPQATHVTYALGSRSHGPPTPQTPGSSLICLSHKQPPPFRPHAIRTVTVIMDDSAPPRDQANLTRSTGSGCTLDVVPAAAHMLLNGQTTPPSPLTDASSAPTLFASASTPNTELTSLPSSEVSKLSLGPSKKSASTTLEEGPTVNWPYSHDVALDDLPGIAFALDTFLKSHMVESEEYCHRNDPRKCVHRFFFFFVPPSPRFCTGR